MLKLTPRIYRPNIKWDIMPKNTVDTVNMKISDNRPEADKTVLTESILDGKPVNSDIEVTLPIDDSVRSTNYNIDICTKTGNDHPWTIGNVAVVMLEGSTTFKLDEPIDTEPTATLRLGGRTYYINKGTGNLDDYQDAINNTINQATWVRTNADGDETWTDKSQDITNRGEFEDPTLVDYTKSSLELSTFTKGYFPAGPFTPATIRNAPEPQDILCKWSDTRKGTCAQLSYWNAYDKSNCVITWPEIIVASGDIDNQKAALSNDSESIYANVVKVDDYTYTVYWRIPVRYIYIAASMYYTTLLFVKTWHEYDNYAFMDIIEEAIVELSFQKMNTTQYDIVYSLDTFNNLTLNAKNKYPITFNRNELLTLEGYYQNVENTWYKLLAKKIMVEYVTGKYIVECDVSAVWALTNGIHINTQAEIVMYDGTKIQRNNIPCIFEVKSIEKIFKGNTFIFSLKLMEV